MINQGLKTSHSSPRLRGRLTHLRRGTRCLNTNRDTRRDSISASLETLICPPWKQPRICARLACRGQPRRHRALAPGYPSRSFATARSNPRGTLWTPRSKSQTAPEGVSSPQRRSVPTDAASPPPLATPLRDRSPGLLRHCNLCRARQDSSAQCKLDRSGFRPYTTPRC